MLFLFWVTPFQTQASASPSVNTVESTPKVEYNLNDFENAPDQQVDDDIDASEDDGGALVIDDSRKTGLKRKQTPSEVDKSKTGSPFLIWGKSRRRELAAQNPGWTPGELAQQLWAQWQKLPEAEKQAVKAKIDPVEETQPPGKLSQSLQGFLISKNDSGFLYSQEEAISAGGLLGFTQFQYCGASSKHGQNNAQNSSGY